MEFELLPENGGYKANLHSHTVDSDGSLTAEEMKKRYIERGYSILAFTDHGFMRDRTSLNDENFVALNGYENHFEPPRKNGKSVKCYHLNFYAPKPDSFGMVGMTYYYYEWCLTYKPASERPPVEEAIIGDFMPFEFNLQNTNEMLAKAKELGYLVVNNHPVWSKETPDMYLEPEGFLGIEMVNYGSFANGWEEGDNGTIYDQILRTGKRQFCFANDDNHHDNGGNKDAFGGYNIMYPDSLTYDGVYNCMKEGKSYASMGAEIHGLYVKDGVVHIGTRNAAYVRIVTDDYMKWIKADKEPLTEANFTLRGNEDYFRIVVCDVNGNKAFSRGYFKGIDYNL